MREVDRQSQVLGRLADCFVDHRLAELIEHSVLELVSQRVFGLALGYEDLNDHDELRWDPLMGLLSGKRDPQGLNRVRERDRGKALAGKSTLNRLELTPAGAGPGARYKKITARPETIDELLVTLFIEAHERPPLPLPRRRSHPSCRHGLLAVLQRCLAIAGDSRDSGSASRVEGTSAVIRQAYRSARPWWRTSRSSESGPARATGGDHIRST